MSKKTTLLLAAIMALVVGTLIYIGIDVDRSMDYYNQ